MAKLNEVDNIAPVQQSDEKREQKQVKGKAKKAEMAIESTELTIKTLRAELDAEGAHRGRIILKYKAHRRDIVLEFVNSADNMDSIPPTEETGQVDIFTG